MMERANAEGISREKFIHALETPSIVRAAVRRNMCMLCRRTPVNAAGICEVCTTQLSEAENRLVVQWLREAMS